MSIPQRVPFVGFGVVVARGGEWLLMRRKQAHGEGTWSTPAIISTSASLLLTPPAVRSRKSVTR